MFGKNTEKLKIILGAQSEFQGELISKGLLLINGFANGKVQADEVILSESAVIQGEIIAKRIIVGGRVEGSLKAEDLVEITSKGKVQGEILTNKLTVMEGGEFNGQIRMKPLDPSVLDFESRREAT